MFEFLKSKKQIQPSRLILDLDAVVSQSVSFNLGGKTYVIPPVDTRTVLTALDALRQLDDMTSKTVISQKDLLEAYVELFASLCPQITRQTVMGMTQPQVLMLRQLMIDCITGKAYVDDGEVKKKTERASLTH